MDKDEYKNKEELTSTIVYGNEIALEAVKRGKGRFVADLQFAGRALESNIQHAAESISKAYTKDKDTTFAVNMTDHATICFSCADGELCVALTVGTGQGLKWLCDMLPAWFQEHYYVTEDGKSVKPRSK